MPDRNPTIVLKLNDSLILMPISISVHCSTVQQGKHRVHHTRQPKPQEYDTEPIGQLTKFNRVNKESTTPANLNLNKVTQNPLVNSQSLTG